MAVGTMGITLRLEKQELSSYLSRDWHHGAATVFSLQDNQPTAGAMAKGRSPSFALNRVFRQKAGYCLAAQIRLFLPWVESAKQPADKSSRIQ